MKRETRCVDANTISDEEFAAIIPGGPRMGSRGVLLLRDPVHRLQRLVPTALQLAGHQTVGIDSIILPASMFRREARLLRPRIRRTNCRINLNFSTAASL